MSGEQITAKKLNSTLNIKSKKTRININVLLTKVRNEKNKEKKENYIFLGLVCALVVATGIIASLWNYIKL